MSEKYKTAAEYHREAADACETALVRLLQAFTTLKSTVRLIGGLVPRYLTPSDEAGAPTHVGTTDVDVVLDVALIEAGDGYGKLRKQLKDAGFERLQTDNGPSSWQWVCKVGDQNVTVEFLQEAEDPNAPVQLVSIAGEDVGACKMPFVGIAQDWYQDRVVTVEMPDGDGLLKETIRHADAVAFIVLKALAMKHRSERKDPADLVHVMRHYDAGPDSIAEEFAERWHSGSHRDALIECVKSLRDYFCDEDGTEGYLKTGPSRFARFHGLKAGSDDAILEQRQVSALVMHFMSRIRELGVDA